MISYDSVRNSLWYLDASGTRIDVFPQEGEAYERLLVIRGQQMEADTYNLQAQADYRTKLGNWQISADAGRAAEVGPPPAKPLKLAVDDLGNSKYVPFPNLPEPNFPSIINAPSTHGFPVRTNSPPDRTDEILALVRKIAEKVGA